MRTLHKENHLIERIGWLRAAVLGANDGLISTSSLIVGVAAATAGPHEVLVAGVAGLVAGAMSMAAGEYVSVSSQADTEEADMARERRELATQPEAELAELAAIYEQRGVAPDLARQVAEQMMAKDAADTTKRVYEVIGVHQEKLFGLLSDNVHTGFVSVSETLPKVFDEMDEIAKRNGAIVGIRTGFNSIDSVLGGLENGELVIVAARPGVGKTSMLMNIATFLGDLNMTCGLFSLEMTRAELVKRMISSVANVDSSRIRGGLLTREEWDIVNPAVNRCSKMSIYIDETSRIRTSEMRAKATRLVKEKGAKLILVDYLQLMRMAERVENRTQEVGQVAQELKAIAKDLNVPVIAAAQLRRIDEMTGRQSRRPTLQDLRESGEIEQVADKVLMLHQPELEIIKQRVMIEGASMPDIKTEVIIAKNRNGRVTTVLLNYHPQTTTFFDYKATAQLASAPVRFFNEPQEDDDSPV